MKIILRVVEVFNADLVVRDPGPLIDEPISEAIFSLNQTMMANLHLSALSVGLVVGDALITLFLIGTVW